MINLSHVFKYLFCKILRVGIIIFHVQFDIRCELFHGSIFTKYGLYIMGYKPTIILSIC